MCKYTFLLPAYKGRFLDEMLKSIQSQTYKDFKVIISDDCSPEELYSICQPYLCDDRFTYRRNVENMGGKDLVAHWNLLVDMCETEWLIMASDDDVYDEHFLQEIDILQQRHPDVDFVRAKANRIDEQGNILTYEGEYKERVTQLEFAAQMHYNIFTMCMANAVFRTKKLKKIGGFVNFPLAFYTDNATMYLLAENGCVNTKIELFYFRISNINLSNIEKNNTDKSFQKVLASIKYHEWFLKFLIKHQDLKDSYNRFLYNFTFEAHLYRTSKLMRGDYELCSIINQIKLYSLIIKSGLKTHRFFLVRAIVMKLLEK